MPDKSVTQVYPLAHAGNGGAIIDEMAETNVPGLLASGECATGMHGANRLGGGMVLATQVFGHRAGLRAAILAREGSACNQRIFRDLVQTRLNSIRVDENELSPGLKDLGRGLSRYAVFGGLPGLEEFRRELKVAEPAKDWRLGLCREAALTFLEELPVSS